MKQSPPSLKPYQQQAGIHVAVGHSTRLTHQSSASAEECIDSSDCQSAAVMMCLSTQQRATSCSEAPCRSP
ncbi:hypothetical protein F7725_022909 [Dissostichus mawsoni]|uniref:Uncharacterized protein n=1 Tax=Dissostichus mawsoni TaxID=36200 RepID=A0A7J5YZ60_DISMA|nr:hypothetical protein F7725_022909 [Dissostichus mawsoni]